MSSYPVEFHLNNNDAQQRQGPLLAALNEVDRLNEIFNETPYSSDDIFSEEDCIQASRFSKQEELVSCLLKMKDLMEEAELETMRLKEEKKLLTKRIGESLVTVNNEMDNLKFQLKEQDRRLKELGASPVVELQNLERNKSNSAVTNLVSEQTEQIIHLQKKLLVYEKENSELKRQNYLFENGTNLQVDGGLEVCRGCKKLHEYTEGLEVKMQKYKESTSVMRQERKKLKSEKLELLDQLKQLYGTLEDKEKELKEFIINYEQRMKDSEETVKQLLVEKERVEKERWELLKVASENSERCITLKTELDNAEENLRAKEEDLKIKDAELGRIGASGEGAVFEFFGLFGKEVSTKSKTESTTQDTTTTESTSKDESTGYGNNQQPYLKRVTDRRPENINIYNSLERSSPILASSTPVPDSSETQYLSLSSPERTEPTSESFSSMSRSPQPYISRSGDFSTCTSDRHSPATPRKSRDRSERSSEVKRASSQLHKQSPRRSPKIYRNASPKMPPRSPRINENEATTPTSPAANGSVLRRQGSSNRRPRTFHPDIMDLASMDEDLTPRNEFANEPKSPRRKTVTGTLSRMFGKDKDKTSPVDGSEGRSPQEEMFDKWNVWDSIQRVPMALWKARDVTTWLQIECCMPMYVKKCTQYIKSGRVLLQMADQELNSILGITNTMHKLKLKLALDDHRYPDRKNISLSKVDHVWVSYTWLKDLGLSQYSGVFEKNLVDGRMVDTFTKKDLEKHFGMTKKLHQVSFFCGLHLLRKVKFDRDALYLRRSNCIDADIDMAVWTNERLIQWALSIDLKECAHKLRDSGLHGALIVFDEAFTIELMANALGITTNKNSLFQHLTSELSPLLKSSRSRLSNNDKLKNGKQKHGGLSRSFSLRWTKKDRPKPKRITPSRSTGNINGSTPTSPKAPGYSEEKRLQAKEIKAQATLL
eukprot:gene15133-16689_t